MGLMGLGVKLCSTSELSIIYSSIEAHMQLVFVQLYWLYLGLRVRAQGQG